LAGCPSESQGALQPSIVPSPAQPSAEEAAPLDDGGHSGSLRDIPVRLRTDRDPRRLFPGALRRRVAA
jgi:hypothetical protein